jgi:hypothetical protein
MTKPFLFRCPTTSTMVQADTDLPSPKEGEPPRYISLVCLACQRVHLVNPHTGRLLSEESLQIAGG